MLELFGTCRARVSIVEFVSEFLTLSVFLMRMTLFLRLLLLTIQLLMMREGEVVIAVRMSDDGYRYYNRPRMLNNKCCSFPAGSKWLCGSLGKSYYPVIF